MRIWSYIVINSLARNKKGNWNTGRVCLIIYVFDEFQDTGLLQADVIYMTADKKEKIYVLSVMMTSRYMASEV